MAPNLRKVDCGIAICRSDLFSFDRMNENAEIIVSTNECINIQKWTGSGVGGGDGGIVDGRRTDRNGWESGRRFIRIIYKEWDNEPLDNAGDQVQGDHIRSTAIVNTITDASLSRKDWSKLRLLVPCDVGHS